MSGKLITFEGIDGAGKTTQINYLADYLKTKGCDVYITREPGGTNLAERVRDIVLDPNEQIGDLTELLLIFAARADHIEKILKPKVLSGTWVICSRFTDATIAYQGFARNIDTNIIKKLANIVHVDFNPDCSFVLDIDTKTAEKRRSDRGGFIDRFEQEKISFMQAVRDGYKEITKKTPRCNLINAKESPDIVCQQIQNIINQKYFS